MKHQTFVIKNKYKYDKLGRLTSVESGDGHEICYAYDAAWNRISVMTKGEARESSVAPAPQMADNAPLKPSSTISEQVSTPESLGNSIHADATDIDLRPSTVEIMVLNGELENQHFSVNDQLRLGRETDNDLSLPDKKASRYHATIQRKGIVYQISDSNSGNGTYVNGQRISQPTHLKDGDIILIGTTQISFSSHA